MLPIIDASSSPYMGGYRKVLFPLMCSEMNIFSEGNEIFKESQTKFSEKFKNDMKRIMDFELLEYYEQKVKLFDMIRAVVTKRWGFDIVEKCQNLRSQKIGTDIGDIFSWKYDSTLVKNMIPARLIKNPFMTSKYPGIYAHSLAPL